MRFRTPLTLSLIAAITTGCTHLPNRSSTRIESRNSDVVELRPSSLPGDAIVRVAAAMIGTPYKFGGDDPQRGFDCSGLVFYSFDRLGLEVPRTAEEQREAARRIERDELTPGDLVFFRTSAHRVDHVGIYAGAGRFIHAPRSGHVVSYAYLDDPYYREHYVSAGRLL
jgi:cell wall-associated NlpC family hydrolase